MHAKLIHLSQDELNELYSYEDGRLYYRKDCDKFHKNAGSEAGTPDSSGYVAITINKKRYKRHRVIWKMFYGTEPALIDHRDRDKTNDKIKNLRVLDIAGNIANSKVPIDSTTGVKGVSYVPSSRDRYKYRVRSTGTGKRKHIGTYETLEEAIAAKEEYDANIE